MTKADKEGQRKAPILRFKGFTDDWEQRKLNEVTTRVLRKNKNLISKRPLTISAQYGLIDQQAFFNKQVASSNLENYLLLEKGEFAYNKSYSDGFPYGTIKKLNLYDNGAVSTLYIAFKANADINSDFLENLFSSNKWNNEVYKIAAEGARNHGLLNISPNDFFNIKITISKDSQEQAFISKFLRVFDNLLALYERKLKLLSQVKKYFLDNLFTEKEYPNLRFKGFTDAWEQRKLGEVTLFIRNGVTVKQNGSYGIPITRIESISTGTLNLKKVGYADIQTDKYKDFYLKNNDILFSNINSLEHIGKTAFVQHLSLDVIHGMNLLNIRINEESISSKFIYYQLLIMKYNNLFKRVAKPAVNQASIATSELKKLVIKIPDVNEQHKIQALLTRLERIITLYENKQQSLSEIKKTLLNTMFI